MVEIWYSEMEDYDFEKGESKWFTSKKTGKKYQRVIGHFTQIVWKTSTHVGFGFKWGKYNGRWGIFAVARYKPSGNVQGKFIENVPPLVNPSDAEHLKWNV